VPGDETWYFLAIGLLSVALFGPGFRRVGFARPHSWPRTIAGGVAVAIVIQLLSNYVSEPLLARLTQQPIDVASLRPHVGDIRFAVLFIVVGWTLGAFREEFVYRGYMMTRVAELGGGTTRWTTITALLFSSILFGLGHARGGVVDAFDAGLHGLILGIVYVATGRNLWMSIVAHGVSDMLAAGLVFMGWF